MIITNNSRNLAIVLLAVAGVLQSGSFPVDAFLQSTNTITTTPTAFRNNGFPISSAVVTLASSSTTTSSTDFSTFADSLDSDLDTDNAAGGTKSSASTTSSSSASTMDEKPWQAKLDDLLDPKTNLADRQILLSELLTSNDKIQDDVMDALTNRKVRKVK